MDWESIKINLKKFLNSPDYETYRSELISDIENHYKQKSSLSFTIKKIREKGFIIKVGGLNGYISFNHMPWKYRDFESWHIVFKSLIGKVLFCKIYQFSREPLLIIANGEIPQFKYPNINENKKYTGIIIKKTNYGVFVEIGQNFKWNFGSLSGLLHKSHFKTDEQFEKIETGSTIKVWFWGFNEKEQLLFGIENELKEWYTGEIDRLVGKILPVKVIKTDIDNTNFLVDNEYRANLPISKSIYQNNKRKIYKAVHKLKDGDTIHCEIIKIHKTNRSLQLKWVVSSEIDEICSRNILQEEIDSIRKEHYTIQSRLSKEVKEKIKLIGKD